MAAAAASTMASENSAAQRVADTPELLEMILLKLTIHDFRGHGGRTIIAAQRVNRYFQTLITNSSRLQRALCFREPESTKYSYNALLEDGIGLRPSKGTAVKLMATGDLRDGKPEPLLWVSGRDEAIKEALKIGSWRKMYIYSANNEGCDVMLNLTSGQKPSERIHHRVRGNGRTVGKILDAAMSEYEERYRKST